MQTVQIGLLNFLNSLSKLIHLSLSELVHTVGMCRDESNGGENRKSTSFSQTENTVWVEIISL